MNTTPEEEYRAPNAFYYNDVSEECTVGEEQLDKSIGYDIFEKPTMYNIHCIL